MSLLAICEIKILTKLSEFSVLVGLKFCIPQVNGNKMRSRDAFTLPRIFLGAELQDVM